MFRPLLFAAALIATACSGGGGDDDDDNQPPADAADAIDAQAGADGAGADGAGADGAPLPTCGAGGVCVSSTVGEQACPDGTRYDIFDPAATCEMEGDRTYCCLPWTEACTYVANSWTLSLDPFTCAAPTTAPAWMCMFTGIQETCEMAATLWQPLGPDLDAAITVTAGASRSLVIEGVLADSDRTFHCEGLASVSFGAPTTWQCDACEGDSCVSCAVETHEDCDL